MVKKLIAGLATALLLTTAGAAMAGSYQAVTGIPYSGASSDRGIAVNSNASSPYYGYFYGIDAASAAVRIWQPDSDGTAALSYSNTGNKLGYSAGQVGASLMHDVFVGPDDTVWVADFTARTIFTGPAGGSPTGENLTAQFMPTSQPRSIFVTGNLGAAGTRVYVAENGALGKKCEIWQYDGASWSLVADMGALGMTDPWFVTVDASGNSYWLGRTAGAAIQAAKVKSDLTQDAAFGFAKPAFLGTGFTPGGIAWVSDPGNTQNPEYFYISGYGLTSVLRFDASGQFLDGFGNTNSPSPPPAEQWTAITFSGPGGNSIVWLAADDQHNTYALVTYPGLTVQAYKVHLQSAPQPPASLQASNDIYGQIRLSWAAPPASLDNPTGYRIYRGTSPGNETLYATTDAYPKWKDTAQALGAGGPFYYRVSSFNGAGESALTEPAGPIAVSASSAPAPGSLGVALSYSEINLTDTASNPGYDDAWQGVRAFLDDRQVAYTVIYDAGPLPTGVAMIGALAIENDDAAGHSLLILAYNRNMTAYTAQCIRDYVEYSQGKVLSTYYNSIADQSGTRKAEYQLAKVYRASALNVGVGGSPFDSDSTGAKYRFLKPIAGAPEAAPPEAAALFAGLTGPPEPFDGAQQANTITYLIEPFGDGTASQAGKWFNSDGVTPSRPDAEDTSLVVGYRDAGKTAVQSVMLGGSWWAQTTGNTSAGFGPGTLSADRLMENILGFLGVPFAPSTFGETIGEAKQKEDGSGVVLRGKVVTRVMQSYAPSPVYIEEPDRSSAVRVVNLPEPLPAEGSLVTITGRVETAQPTAASQIYERQVSAAEAIVAGTGSAAPVVMGTKSAGGSAMGAQFGVDGGVGLNTLGLLTRITGRLTEFGADGVGQLFFRLDDGGGIMQGSQTQPGIKVLSFAPSSNIGDMIEVIGVLGSEKDGEAVVPVIRLREFETGTVVAP